MPKRRLLPRSSSHPPSGRLSKGQELALFVFLMLVLLVLIGYGLRA